MEKTVKMNGGDYSVVEEEGKAGFGGGVEDVYGEDSATEDQLVTPWTVSVARWDIMRILRPHTERLRLLTFICLYVLYFV